MSRSLVVGNWKMHGNQKNNQSLLNALCNISLRDDVEAGICVPYIYLSQAQEALTHSRIRWGAQDISIHAQGAYTGEISAAMLADFHCHYVITGHSERREYHHESNGLVAKKAMAALNHGLTPILCVGETRLQRESEQTLTIVGEQLSAALALMGEEEILRIVIAYEPVWAIGSGLTATPEQAQEVHHFIRDQLGRHGSKVKILYGGSVNPLNARDLFSQPDIDGGLIGGSSLKAEDFAAVLDQA